MLARKLLFIFFIFSNLNLYSQVPNEKIKKDLLLDNEEISMEGNKEIYYNVINNIKNVYLDNEKNPLEVDVRDLLGKQYIYILISENKIQTYNVNGEFKLIFRNSSGKDHYLHVKYKPKLIDSNIENSKLEVEDNPASTEANNDTQKKETSYKTTLREFSRGDNILNDAKYLIMNLENGKNSQETRMLKQDVLKKYNILYDSIHNYQFLKFYKEYLGEPFHSKEYQYPSSNIAKTDVTNFATGMARFLAERAKAELNESFFIQMRKQMEKIPELQIYFPESYKMLSRINAYNMNIDLEQLRTRFNQDIQKLPFNIYNTVQQTNIDSKYPQLYQLKQYFNEDSNGILVSYTLETVLESQGRINPKELLYKFAHGQARNNLEKKLESRKDVNGIKNTVNSIKLVELISNSLLSEDPNRYWVTEKDIEELFTNEDLLKTYIGLVLAKSKFDNYDIKFNDKSLKELIEAEYTNEDGVIDSKLPQLKSLIKNFYYSYNEVDNVISQLKTMNTSQAIDDSYKIFNVLKVNLDIINSQLLSVIDKSEKSYQINHDLIYNYVSPAIDISYNIYTKKYPQAIKEFTSLLQNSLSYNNLSENSDYNKFISKFTIYGTLIANVATAQNSDDVKAAISASVLPVGSSRMKRYSDWSITLNAYVGGYVGRAFYKDFNGTNYENKSITTFGITAPIGISFNKGKVPFFGSKSTIGLTLQVIDLGSLVNFYAQKGDGAVLPQDTKIELGDIIAPGGMLSYSIGDTPFTLLGGVQYVPNLSRLETIATNTEFKPLTWRYHIGLAIDIPLFNLKVWN